MPPAKTLDVPSGRLYKNTYLLVREGKRKDVEADEEDHWMGNNMA